MKKMNLFWLLGLVLLMSACNNDDPQPVNEEEEITTLRITFTAAGEAPISFNWRDLDGEGGTAPVIDAITLNASKTYEASILVLNENEAINLENESYNVTLEVSEEDDEHQFFYTKSAGLNLTHSYDDLDANGNPVGINSIFLTGAASTGTLTVTLKHQPGIKSATTGINDGETDIAVTFNTTIQ
jgi:hypothetical protein